MKEKRERKKVLKERKWRKKEREKKRDLSEARESLLRDGRLRADNFLLSLFKKEERKRTRARMTLKPPKHH